MSKYVTATTSDTPFITDYELMLALAPYTPVKRKAILFVIASGMNPEEVEVLSWADLKGHSMNPAATEILNSLPRHLFSSLVFWEIYEDVPIMLTHLQRDCEQVAKPYDWETFAELATNLVSIMDSAYDFIQILMQKILLQHE